MSPDASHLSSWEILHDTSSEPIHESAACSSESLCKSSFPVEECELGCDALEVFEMGGESVVLESTDIGGECVHCVETAGSASESTDTSPVPAGKMDRMKRLSHPKHKKKLTVPKTILRHCSAPEYMNAAKTSPQPDPKRSRTSAQPNGSHISSDSSRSSRPPLTVPHENTGNISPRHLDKFQPMMHGTVAGGSDDPDLGDLSEVKAHMPVTPMTAPPLTFRHNEPTLMDRMNRKLLNYLKVVRTLKDKGTNDRNWSRKRQLDARVIQVIDLTSDSLVASASVGSMTYAEYLALGMFSVLVPLSGFLLLTLIKHFVFNLLLFICMMLFSLLSANFKLYSVLDKVLIGF